MFNEYISGFIKKFLRNIGKYAEEEIHAVVRVAARRASSYIIRQLVAVMILSTSVLFLLLAFLFFLIEYLAFTKTMAFLVVGVVLLFIGIIAKTIR